uniref:Homeobox domain-containing protein n=1 Tax=Cyclopterus lumpus TaxID=8103 RepID=A0A8C2WKI1_CYCLU
MPQVKSLAPSPVPSFSNPITKTCTLATDLTITAPTPSSPFLSQTQECPQQEAPIQSTAATATSQTTAAANAVPLTLPNIPMLPLALPQLPISHIPFSMDLPLLPSVVMQSVAQNQSLSLSPCPLSPGLLAHTFPQTQTTDLLRGETHRGRRSSRTRFTERQLETLQGVFEATPYPREEEYDSLSALLSLPNRIIVVWFQNARQRKNGCSKIDDVDNSCGDEAQGESQNENSMDLTYEYYTNPDSPVLDSSSHCIESEHLTDNGEPTPVMSKQENTQEDTTYSQANKSLAHVQIKNEISDAEIQRKEIVQAMKTASSPQLEPNLQPESTPERLQPHSSSSSSSSQKTVPAIASTAHSSQGQTCIPPSDPAVEKPVDTSPSLPAYPCDEGSSMADQGSPSPEGSGGPSSDWGETQSLQQHQHQQQRQRTQMSHFQVLQLRDFYRSHRTPNRHECETLGQELGLPHRVVQVNVSNIHKC